ncbi:MAG: hypothetical protein LWW77_09935 [Propionibacteriales bacterium]|nr:hypothetical protein [Propionibacteriales bacterium]
MKSSRTITIAVSIATCIAVGSAFPVAPAQAQPTFPSSPPPACVAGTPLRGDYNGDGVADPAVQAWTSSVPQTTAFQIRLTPDSGAWLDGAQSLRPADLNGDTCSDAVVTYTSPTAMVKLFRGSPSGLQDTGIVMTPPQVTAGDHSWVDAIVLRHDRLVQVVVAGSAKQGFVDVYTLNKAGVPGAPQIVAGASVKHVRSNGFGGQLAGSGRTVVIGSPNEHGSRHTYQGAVYLLRSSASNHKKLVLRARITQSSKGIFGSPGQGHRLGSAVAYRSGIVAIGMDGETAATGKSGVVQLLSWPDSSRGIYRAGRVIRRGGPANTDGLGWQFGYQITLARGLTAKGSTDLVASAHDGSQGGSVVIANTKTTARIVLNAGTTYLPQQSWYQEGYTVTGVIRATATRDRLLIRVGDDTRPICGPGSTYVTLSSPGVISAQTTWTELPPPDCSTGYVAWGSDFQ